jgi:hypothetical protein
MKKTTPLDEIKAALNEMTAHQFYYFVSTNYKRLKQNEVNRFADVFFEGIQHTKKKVECLIGDGVLDTERYTLKQFGIKPTLD